MKALLKGETTTIKVKFPAGVVFPSLPTWELLDWDEDVLQSGTAVSLGGGEFSASITIPSNLVVPDGEAEVLIQFTGIDDEGKSYLRGKDLVVVDLYDNWKSYGLLWYPGMTMLEETVLYAYTPNDIKLSLREGYGGGVEVNSSIFTSPAPVSTTQLGYVFKVSLTGSPPAVNTTAGWFPYQLFITANFASQPQDVIVKPVYVPTPLVIGHINSVRRYLDKARIDELDKNLNWTDEELMHFLLEGSKHINGIGEVSYWTPDSIPSSLYSHLVYASSLLALNARYLAEGFNAFDFQGANTQLVVDRRDSIAYKIDELRGILEQTLPLAKSKAIQAFGPGTPPPGVVGGKKALGALGLNLSPVTNRTAMYRRGRLYR